MTKGDELQKKMEDLATQYSYPNGQGVPTWNLNRVVLAMLKARVDMLEELSGDFKKDFEKIRDGV